VRLSSEVREMPRKSVLITGSSKGLGRALAAHFSNQNYDIILHGRNEPELKMQKNLLTANKDYPLICDIVKGDLLSQNTIAELYAVAEKRDIDILINNAAIYCKKPFKEMTVIEIRRMIEVNLTAPIILTASIYHLFLKKRSGMIININSIAGKKTNELESLYCATKHGLRGFSASFQTEANRNNIQLIDVYLGAMNTAITKERADHNILIEPQEVARAIYNICKNHESLRITEVDILRKRY